MKILIVDDREDIRKLLCMTFQDHGFETMEVQDGFEALQILKSESPDIIISDILMPNVDGYRLCKAVRENPKLAGIPFIIYTGTCVSSEDEAMAMKCGADLYMTKPSTSLDLLKAVTELVSSKGAPRPSTSGATLAPPGEEEILRQYNEVLVRKLEEKNEEFAEQNRRLLASEEKFRQLIENMHQVYFLTGPGGAPMLYASPSYKMVWGAEPESLYTDPLLWLGAVIAEDRPALEALIKSRPDGFETEYRIKTPQAEVRWIRERSFPVRDASGALVRQGWIAEDITALKAAEARLLQAHKMESVGRLAGGAAHDFNNMLSAIIGLTDLVLKELPEGSPVRRDIEHIRENGYRASRLTQQLLAFSRRQIFEPKVLDLNELVAGLDKMLRRVLGEDVDLLFTRSSSPSAVWVDPVQIEQIIVNLCLNARDAMPGGGTLRLTVMNVVLDEGAVSRHQGLSAGEHVLLAVQDSGTGMTEEVKTHLFEPFFTTKEPGKGTGLGLATCYGIVKQSGGAIAVDSELGKGTTFSIYFPRSKEPAAPPAKAPPAAKTEPPTAQKAPAASGAQGTILLAEDEAAVRMVASRMLATHGYKVLEAKDADEALRLVKQDAGKEIRLILTDVVMPKGGGKLVADKLKFVRGDIRIIFMSGYTDEVVVRQGVLKPGTLFIRKPFTEEALMTKVNEALQLSPGAPPAPPSSS